MKFYWLSKFISIASECRQHVKLLLFMMLHRMIIVIVSIVALCGTNAWRVYRCNMYQKHHAIIMPCSCSTRWDKSVANLSYQPASVHAVQCIPWSIDCVFVWEQASSTTHRQRLVTSGHLPFDKIYVSFATPAFVCTTSTHSILPYRHIFISPFWIAASLVLFSNQYCTQLRYS